MVLTRFRQAEPKTQAPYSSQAGTTRLDGSLLCRGESARYPRLLLLARGTDTGEDRYAGLRR